MHEGPFGPDTLGRVEAGQVCLMRGFLEPDLAMCRALILGAVERACGGKVPATNVSNAGLERVHEVLAPGELRRVVEDLARVNVPGRLRPLLVRVTRDLARSRLGLSGPLWLDAQPVVRFYVPQDCWDKAPHQLGLGGHLKIQGPHKDDWFGHSLRGVNLWMAVGRVRRGNGLSVYPDLWGRDFPHDGKFMPPRDARLGRPLNFDLSPGDALLFHGQHVHASELNWTDETRVAFTTRFSTCAPEFTEGGNHPWELDGG